MLTYLAEITAYDSSISGTRTLYFSTLGYTSKTSDTPASQHYEARLMQPGLMRRDIFSQGTTGGASTTGYGVVELINLGDLDAMVDYGFDGRKIRILLGDTDAALSTFTVVLNGTMEQAEFTWERLTIRIRDRLAELDKTCQTVLFAGTNSGPTGQEGLATDLKGKPKPKLFGQVFNIAPPQVNSSQLIYQVSDTAINSIDAVYDDGEPLTAEAVYTSLSDMTTNAPSEGCYRVWPSGGMFRIGSSPLAAITCDATQGASAANRTVAQILSALAQLSGTVISSDIYTADITALDSANSNVVGIYLGNGENIKSAMDEVGNSIGAWYGFDRLGRMRMGQLTIPSGTPVATFDYQDIIQIDRIASNDTDRGVPAYQVVLGYSKNYTVTTLTFKANVNQDRINQIAEQYRTVAASDTSVQAAHLLSPIISKNTLLVDPTDAGLEATRILNIYKVRRDRLTAKIRVQSGSNYTIDLNDVVQISTTRFGYSGGKLFRVIGIQQDFRIGSIELTLWG